MGVVGRTKHTNKRFFSLFRFRGAVDAITMEDCTFSPQTNAARWFSLLSFRRNHLTSGMPSAEV